MSQKIIGEPNKNIVLETAGRFYIKVGQRYYEIDFRNLDKTKTDENAVKKIAENVAEEAVKNVEKQDLSNYVTFPDLEASQSNYVTQRDFEDVKATQEALQNAFQDEFTESIKPATVQTMQMVVGSDQLQFQWIKSFEDDSLASEPLYVDMATKELVYKPGYIKHYTLGGPSEVKPEDDTHKNTKDYYRWYIETPGNGIYTETLKPESEFREQLLPGTYYYYIQVPFVEIAAADVDAPDKGPTAESKHKGNIYFYYDNKLYPGTVHTAEYKGIYAKTGVGQLVKTATKMDYVTLITVSNIGTEAEPVYESQYLYNFLYAVVSLSTLGGIPSIATMNGFTEITPGQIRAYMFSSPDGSSYLDLKNSKFKLGSDLMFEDGSLSLRGGLLAGLVCTRDSENNIVSGINGTTKANVIVPVYKKDGNNWILAKDKNGNQITKSTSIELTEIVDNVNRKITFFSYPDYETWTEDGVTYRIQTDVLNSATKIYTDGTLYTKKLKAEAGYIGSFSLTNTALTSNESFNGGSYGVSLNRAFISLTSKNISGWSATHNISTYPLSSAGREQQINYINTLSGFKHVDTSSSTGPFGGPFIDTYKSVGIGIYNKISGCDFNYATYSMDGMYAGLRPKLIYITGPNQIREDNSEYDGDWMSNNLGVTNHTVFVNSETELTLNLPENPPQGQVYKIFQIQSTKLIINGNGKLIWNMRLASEDTGQWADSKGCWNIYWVDDNDKWFCEFTSF